MKKKLLFLCVLSGLTEISLQSQDTLKAPDKILSFGASYTADVFNVLKGGIKTGSVYLGMANVFLEMNTEAAGLWKGGRLLIHGANTHGAQPSALHTGDYQVASNIEAGNHTYIQELQYSQELGPVEITAGLQDLNVAFANTGNGSAFVNSSFGILPTISCNVPAPIFPLTALGLSVTWQISEKVGWLTAVYDGCPTDFEDNPYNVRWELNSRDGTLLVSEGQYSATTNSLSGTYKAGLFTHISHSNDSDESIEESTKYQTNYGFYAIADQVLWKEPAGNKSLGLFVQLGISPSKINQNLYFMGAGINFSGLVNKAGGDILGVALAHAGLNGGAGHETTFEVTWQIPLNKHIFIQPDVQYIMNPSGTGDIDNCLAAIFRFAVGL